MVKAFDPSAVRQCIVPWRPGLDGAQPHSWLARPGSGLDATAAPLLHRWMKGNGGLVRVLCVLRPLRGLASLYCIVFTLNHGKTL